MGKFGIGARVRDEDGDEGVIVEKRKGERLVRYDSIYGLPGVEVWVTKSYLTAIDKTPAAAEQKQGDESKFKVGDRVRLLTDEGEGRPAGSVGTVVGVEEYGCEGVRVAFDDPFDGWEDENDVERCWFCSNEQIENLADWQPKVGDKVRCTKDCDPGMQFTAGKEYVVRYVTNESIDVVADDKGAENGWAREYFELIHDWRPKVGDRVRFKEDYCGTALGETGKVKSSDPAAEPTDGFLVGVALDSGKTQFVFARRLEPLPVAAEAQGAGDAPAGTLQIQAGRYYRTRDGRKVGPIYKSGRLDWPLESEVAYHKVDGTAPYLPHYDLVAEWIDEPAVKLADAEPVAVAPATATPVTKGSLVQLSAPALVTGTDRHHAHLLLGTGGTYTLPVAALVAA